MHRFQIFHITFFLFLMISCAVVFVKLDCLPFLSKIVLEGQKLRSKNFFMWKIHILLWFIGPTWRSYKFVTRFSQEWTIGIFWILARRCKMVIRKMWRSSVFENKISGRKYAENRRFFVFPWHFFILFDYFFTEEGISWWCPKLCIVWFLKK